MINQAKSKKYLILFTLHYPYHYMDSFIDPEIEKLAKTFDHIYIFSHNTKSDILREIPANSTAYRIDKSYGMAEKLKLSSLFVSSIWRNEQKAIKNTYGLPVSISVIKTAFSYYASALKLKSTIEHLIQEKGLVDGQIFVYSFFLTEATLAAALLKNKYKLKIVTRLHGYDLYFERENNNYLPFRPYLVEQLSQLFFISQNGLTYFKEKLKISTPSLERKLSLNYLGTTQLKAPNSSKTDLYPNQLVLVSNSWVLPLKRLHLIADALRLMPKDKQVTWIHFGDAIGIEKEYCESFFNNVADLKSSHANINFILKGATDRDDILAYYHQNRIDALVNVSATEGVPISMMEAFSAGFSVIGTNVGGVSEIVNEGVNGYLLKPNPTVEEIAATFIKFQQLTLEEKGKFQRAAYETWQKKFDAMKNSDIFVKNLLEL
jgi:glycosyltransferase involved in cell wall biosynthesis